MNEQTQQISRVNHAIASYVTAYLKLKEGKEFHATDLYTYVHDQVGGYIAPDSPARILRDLKKRGLVNYEVLSRSRSLYRAIPREVYQPSLI